MLHGVGRAGIGIEKAFDYDVLQLKPFSFTLEESRIQIQLKILMIFLKNGGLFLALEDYWTNVGVATGHLASVVDFNRSPAHFSVGNFCICCETFLNLWCLIIWSICGHRDYFLPVIMRNRHFFGNRTHIMPMFHIVLASSSSLMLHLFTETYCHGSGPEKVYSVEFAATSVRGELDISFWEGNELITMTNAHCGRDVLFVRSSVLFCSQATSVGSLELPSFFARVEELVFLKHWTKPHVRKPFNSTQSICYHPRLRN